MIWGRMASYKSWSQRGELDHLALDQDCSGRLTH